MPFDPAAARFGGSGGAVTTEAGSGSLLPTQKRDDWAAVYEEMEGKLCEKSDAVYEEMEGKLCEKDDDGEEGI